MSLYDPLVAKRAIAESLDYLHLALIRIDNVTYNNFTVGDPLFHDGAELYKKLIELENETRKWFASLPNSTLNAVTAPGKYG